VSVTGANSAMPRVRVATHSFGFWLAVIVALGIGIRVAHTLLVAPWPPTIFDDTAYYSSLAELIAHGKGFIRPAQWFANHLAVPTAERAPLYPFLLAGLAKLSVSADALRLLGAATGGGAIVAVGLLGRRVAGARAGLLAAGIAAAYPTLIAADGALMTESLYGLLAAFSLVAAYRLLDAPSIGRALVLGAVVGLAGLTRGEGLLLLPLLLVPLVRRAGLRSAAVVCLMFAVVLAPWTVRNLIVFDRIVPVATEGGETLAGANCDSVYHGGKLGTWDVTCLKPFGRGNEAAELDKAGQEGVRYAVDHLGRVPLVMAARLGRTWGFYGPFQVPEGRSKWVMHLGVAIYFALLPLAAYGLVVLRRRRVGVWILLVPFVTATLTTLSGYGNLRFRHSAELSLVVLAAVALDGLWRRTSVRRPAPRARTAAPRPAPLTSRAASR
jgi:4-amino-4-deoxy-L-arabinose transferase-like glycosyltransferase